MSVVSSVSQQKSWQTRRQRVSVLAEMALRKDNIVRRLVALREQHGLTQEGAAHKVGVTSRQWQRWESGDSVPYPRNLDQIASKFGIAVAEFFEGDGNGPPVAVAEDAEDRLARMEAQLAQHAERVELLLSEQTELLGLIRSMVEQLTPLLPGTDELGEESDDDPPPASP